MINMLLNFFLLFAVPQEHEFDKYYNLINAYELRYKGKNIFSELNNFIEAFGYPDSLFIGKKPHVCKNKSNFDSLMNKSQDFIPLAIYSNMQFMIVGGIYIIPSLIDLRNGEIQIFLDNISFSSQYRVSYFEKDFSKSFQNPVNDFSFFKYHNISVAQSKVESFFLTKYSIDDKESRQLIEFVFLDGKLGFIVFNNF